MARRRNRHQSNKRGFFTQTRPNASPLTVLLRSSVWDGPCITGCLLWCVKMVIDVCFRFVFYEPLLYACVGRLHGPNNLRGQNEWRNIGGWMGQSNCGLVFIWIRRFETHGRMDNDCGGERPAFGCTTHVRVRAFAHVRTGGRRCRIYSVVFCYYERGSNQLQTSCRCKNISISLF